MPATIEWFQKYLTDTDNRVLSVPSKNLDNFVHFQGRSCEASLKVEDEEGHVFNMRCCKRKGKYKKPVMRGEWRRFFTLKKLHTGDKVKFYKVNDEAAGAKYKIKVQKAQELQGRVPAKILRNDEAAGAKYKINVRKAQELQGRVPAKILQGLEMPVDINYPQDQSAESKEVAVQARSSERMLVDINYPQDQSAESTGAAVQAYSSERMLVDINYPPVPQKPSPVKLFGVYIYQ